MASSRVTSNGPGLIDTARALKEFEALNSVSLVITLRTVKGRGAPDIWLEGRAVGDAAESGVPKLLASVSVTCLASGHTSLDTALFRMLYALDFELAEIEVRKIKPSES